ELIGAQTAEIQDAFPGLFVAQEIEDIGTFGRRKLWMGMVDIKPRPIGQDFIYRHVVLLVRNVVLIVQLEAPSVYHRILLIEVPQQLERLVSIITIDEQQGGGNGIELRIVLNRKAIFRFRTKNFRERHDTSRLRTVHSLHHSAGHRQQPTSHAYSQPSVSQ